MELKAELLEPIPGDNPAGANLRYEPIYDQIKQARTEELDAPQGDWERERKTADWVLVEKLAGDVLAAKSKDLQVAAWFAEALLKRHGFAGLRAGLELLRGLVEKFWDHVYPELEDGDAELRAAPLEWVGAYLDPHVRTTALNTRGHGLIDYRGSRTVPSEEDARSDREKAKARESAVEAGRITPEDWDAGFAETNKAWYKALVADLNRAISELAALEGACAPFGDVAPGFRKLQEALEEVLAFAKQLLAKKLETDPDPPELEEAEPEVTASVGGGEGAAAGGSGEAGGISAMPKSRDDAMARVAAAARFMRKATPEDPASYLMLRGMRWGELRAGGRTVDPKLLVAPPTDARSKLKAFLLDGRWPELLDAAEEVMASPFGRGWLDLQRYVLAACDGMGYSAVGASIKGALRALIEDLPSLPELTLMDDSPTANAETRKWLRDEIVNTNGGEVERAHEFMADGDGDRGRDVYAQAMSRVRSGKPQQGVALLMREAAQEKSPRARFLRRSQAARIMVDAGLEAVARPILEEMLQQIEKHDLEDWESGETVAQPMVLLYRIMERMGENSSAKQELYLRVCRLDPMQAIHFAGGDEQPGA